VAGSGKHHIEWIARATSLLPLVLAIVACAMLPKMAAGESYRLSLAWVPALGVDLSFMFDGLSILFALIISIIGFFVTIYAVDYLHGHPQTGRFFVFLHAFMLSMLGLVTADNVLAMFVFWELTTIFSYLLIGFEHEAEESRKSARQALLVTGAGGLALLVGFLLLEVVTGTYEISEMAPFAGHLKAHPLYGPALALILIGAFTKSAQFPFHFWLPNAMAAPAPISAFLHSATMVKGGIYLLARFHPILGGTDAWTCPLMIIGAVTAVGGAVIAMGQSDLKKILAYTTITALGIMTMFLGGSSTPSLTAAMTFLLVHSLYKSALFLVAGIIDHQTGTRQLEKLGGLVKFMPFTAFAAAAACLSMAGFPLFFGFIGKEIMYKGALAEALCPELAAGAAVFSNALMTAVAGILTIRPFLKGRGQYAVPVREATIFMWGGPVILGGLDIAFGIFPEWVAHWLVAPAVRAFHFSSEDIKLHLFHGINMPLLLSIITLTLGVCFYLTHRSIHKWVSRARNKMPVTASRVYEGCLHGVADLGKLQTRLIQNGSLHRYFFIVAATFLLVTGYSFLSQARGLPVPGLPILAWREWLLVIAITAAVVTVLATRVLLLAICALGVIGAGLAIIFLSYGAPDLALTQLLVETLTVVIVSIILLRLPGLGSQARQHKGKRLLDVVLAAGTGILVTTLLLAVLSTDLDRSITAFFEQKSYLAAHGKNIVNVILVDFRSMDTLGEIIVVATAGLAGYALIRNKRSQ
jgi:multicomponent Na+:H+ antiporter subunit A